jgi:hypothetical protein
MSKASERQAAFVEHVRRVVSDAHAAADKASEAFAATAKRSPEGHILDASGGARIEVYKPSYRLREALKTLGITHGSFNGSWVIRGKWMSISDQSVTLEETGARAACEVFRKAFAGDGEFYAKSYLS